MILALDKSARTIDADGRLHVAKSHISKAAVNPYYGKEIPDYDSLGLQPDKVYYLLRDPVELERGADTFARLPVLKDHVPVTVDSPQPDLVIGAIGSDVSFNKPYLDADIVIWDKDSIAAVESGQVKELSCGYRYVPVMESGEYDGVHYDGRMTEIRGNHLALVESGRAGNDVVVGDSNTLNEVDMRKGKARQVLMALDATLSPEQLDNIIDALVGVEENNDEPEQQPQAPEIAGDDDNEGQVRSLLAGKVDDDIIAQIVALLSPPVATDEEPNEEDMDEKIKMAKDSMRKEFKDLEQAKADVRHVVGDVLGMDSAKDVYSFALNHLQIAHDGIDSLPALKALVKLAGERQQAPLSIAQDSAGLAEKFPNALRFRG